MSAPARRPCLAPRRRALRGMTLVSLMVGTALSLLVVAAMLLVFRSVVRTTVQARQGAGLDAQRTSALLAAGAWMQEAGFGVADARAGQQLLVLSNARLQDGRLAGDVASGAPRGGNALVWEARVEGVLQCRGLYAPAAGGLQRLGPVPCADGVAAAWSTLAWSPAVVADAEGAAALFELELLGEAGACGPFGIPSGQGRARVQLRMASSAGVDLRESQCLFNLAAPGT